MKDLKTLIHEYLQSTRMMQIATCAKNVPWNCTVYFAYDEELNLYWISKPTRRHSQEIIDNPRVAAVIVHDQQPPQSAVRGLQCEGIAELLSGADEEKAAKIYTRQLDREESLLQDIRSGENPHKFYRIRPRRFVLFDRINFPEQEQQEYVL